MIGFYLDKIKSSEYDKNEKLLLEYYENKCKNILNELVKNNVGLVNYIINKRYPSIEKFLQMSSITYDDLFSAGVYGLLKAIKTFKPEKGFKFATYATRCIHNELGIFIRTYVNKGKDNIYIYTKVNKDSDGYILYLYDLIEDAKDYIGEAELKNQLQLIFLKINEILSNREKQIFDLYFIQEKNQKDIGQMLNISQSYVSRILKSISVKIKKDRRIGG